MLLEELSEICSDFELVGIGIRSLALAQLLHLATSDLVVLLCLLAINRRENRTSGDCWTYIWGKFTLFFFLCLSGFLSLGFGRSGSGLLALLFFLQPLFLAFLELALAV